MQSEKTYSNVSEMLIEKIFGLNYQIASELHANRRLKRARLQSTIHRCTDNQSFFGKFR